MVSLFLLVMGGKYVGIFTPTEAGGIGAFGAMGMALVRKRLTRHSILDSLIETGRSTCMILAIIIGAMIFMDALAMLVLTLPIIFPVIEILGFDPVWFGVLIVVVAEIGLITPPYLTQTPSLQKAR
jgi:TRAP-type C4-dicarboxylate transport system permease large subunit